MAGTVTSVRGFLAFKLGSEEYCIDILRAQDDGVCDVITLKPEQIRPVPEISSALSSDFLLGIGSAGDRMLILLDIEKFMTGADMGLVTQTLQKIN